MASIKTVGVDGCVGGWVVCALIDSKIELPYVVRTFDEVLMKERDAAIIAVDIPIGLKRKGESRKCDSAARALLRYRSCCVFNAPDRDVIPALSFSEAQRLSRSNCNKGITAQAFGIFKKVQEVDNLLRASSMKNVIEVHPEVCFFGIAGTPISETKRKAEGYARRQSLLENEIGKQIISRAEVRKTIKAKPDDYLDALASAYTAKRYAEGKAKAVSTVNEFDEFGLPMQMWY